MLTDHHDPDRRFEPAGWRPPPRCYARPAVSEAVEASRSEAEASMHTLALGVLLSVISCISVFLLVQSGWSF